MKRALALLTLMAAAFAAPAFAQSTPLQLPPALEKSLAAKASDVTEVTLGKNMLDFASKFMDGKNKGDEATRNLIKGLDGIYVRSYEFDKEGLYSMDDVMQLRRAFTQPEWTPIVHTHERKSGETTDIMVKQVNGENRGMFIFTAEPKELTIVLILGPIRMQDLGALSGLSGLSGISGIDTGDNKSHSNNNSNGSSNKATNGKDGDE
ncbi:MAG: DUF4252 domain-containing protein [Acidobacteriota bacterium]|nr:DUF4252 domain-containing protein [Acidobacteriota bacterium]